VNWKPGLGGGRVLKGDHREVSTGSQIRTARRNPHLLKPSPLKRTTPFSTRADDELLPQNLSDYTRVWDRLHAMISLGLSPCSIPSIRGGIQHVPGRGRNRCTRRRWHSDATTPPPQISLLRSFAVLPSPKTRPDLKMTRRPLLLPTRAARRPVARKQRFVDSSRRFPEELNH